MPSGPSGTRRTLTGTDGRSPSQTVREASAQYSLSVAFTFRARHRLTHARQFAAVYARRCRAARGPLVVFAARNQLPHPRLGLSVGRRVGPAVRRNRMKRLIRESFRLIQHELPRAGGTSVDLVVSVHPHEELRPDEYRRLLGDLVAMLVPRLERDARKEER